jgi:hypothetical protein
VGQPGEYVSEAADSVVPEAPRDEDARDGGCVRHFETGGDGFSDKSNGGTLSGQLALPGPVVPVPIVTHATFPKKLWDVPRVPAAATGSGAA